MRNLCLCLLVTAGCIIASAQAKRPPVNPGIPCGRSAFDCLNQQSTEQKQALSPRQIQSGAFALLIERSGVDSDQLQKFYEVSASENFHSFGTAVLAATELKFDAPLLLDKLYSKSLVDALCSLGASKKEAKQAIASAGRQMKKAGELADKKSSTPVMAKRFR